MKTRIILYLSLFNVSLLHAQVTDIDGNNYKTAIIVEQEWMAAN